MEPTVLGGPTTPGLVGPVFLLFELGALGKPAGVGAPGTLPASNDSVSDPLHISPEGLAPSTVNSSTYVRRIDASIVPCNVTAMDPPGETVFPAT